MDLGDARTPAKFVLHDRDASFTQAFDAVFQAAGIRVIRSAVQAPRMNSVMERWIGSCRRELLDRTLIWNQRHLMMVLRDRASPTWIISRSGGITARVASSTNIAWWHRFSAPTSRTTNPYHPRARTTPIHCIRPSRMQPFTLDGTEGAPPSRTRWSDQSRTFSGTR
jgi:hypothetical protein